MNYKNDLIHQSLKPPPKDFTSPNFCKPIQKDVTRKYQRSISSKTHSRRNRENLCISSIENIIIKTNYNDVDYVNSDTGKYSYTISASTNNNIITFFIDNKKC